MKTVILISGFARAGKDTLASGILASVAPSRSAFGVSFAYPLKAAANAYLKAVGLFDANSDGSVYNPDSPDFFDDAFKTRNREVLVALGHMSRAIKADVFVEALARHIEEAPNASVIVVPDWRYLNELTVLRNRLAPKGWRVVTVRIDTVGIGPSNDEELKSIAEIRRKVATDFEFTFVPNSAADIKSTGKQLALRLGLGAK